MIMITGINEIILNVEDMDKMVCFYRDTIGLKVQYPQNVDSYEKEPSVTFWTGTSNLSLHAGRKNSLGEDSPKIVFGVKDIEHAQSYLCRRNVRIGELHILSPGTVACDALDPEGNPFSLAYQELIYEIPSRPL